jgi:two-component system chemotaxis sensor kinase CheA
LDELTNDFLAESRENLDRLDQELVKLESDPTSAELISSIFRTIHTIKGTCGFLGFTRLEKVAHTGENLLSRLRDGKLKLNGEITSGLLAMVDAVRQMLGEIATTGKDGEEDYSDLMQVLTRLQQSWAEAPLSITEAKPPKKASKAAVPAGNGETPKAPPQEQAVLTVTPVEEPEPSVPDSPQPAVTEAKASPKHRPAPGKIGGVLVERGHARAEDIAFSLQEQEKGDRRRVGEILVAMGLAKPEDVLAAQQILESRTHETEADTIRVGVNLLDKLMTLVGELVLARNQLLQFSNNIGDPGFQAISQRMNLIATELQEEVMKTRMQPIRNIWSKFPRTVRDVAVGCGKEVRIEMEGKETELDKTIIEAIKDPLTHLVRNAVDHGIETPEARVRAGKDPAGRLALRAFHEGGQVNIEISDDGAGLDVDRIRKKAVERGLISAESVARMQDRDIFNLIFLPGLSTAEKVTNVSGRGVGMDVVKTNVEKIGGTVDIHSMPGRGTTVRVKIPLTLAIIPALIVTCGENRFAIPQVALMELVSLDGREASGGIEMVHGAPVCRLRGRLLPLVYLSRELQLAERSTSSAVVNVVVLRADDRQFGLVVDGIRDTEEIVVKPLRKQLKSIKTFAGASIMGDGRVALILDVMGLAQRAGVITELKEKLTAESAEQIQQAAGEKQRFLLFAGPGESRMAVPLDTVARLEELPRTQVEKTGQQWVTQYRGKILPLVNLALVLEERRGARRNAKLEGDTSEGHLQMLVCNHGGDAVGLVVERILDIVEDVAQVKYPPSRAGVLYSAVIAGQVTELIDVPAILVTAGVSTKPMESAEVAR